MIRPSKKFPSWVRVLIYLSAFVFIQVFIFAFRQQFAFQWKVLWFSGEYATLALFILFTFAVGKVFEMLLDWYFRSQFGRR